MFAILSSLIRVYSICHSHQSDQGQHCLPFSAVWSGSTLLAILSRIRIYTIWNSQQSDEGLHYLPFFLSNIIKVSTVCHSQQSDQGLQYLPFSAVWSGSTTLAILSSLIRIYIIYHSQQSDQGLFAILSLIRVYTVCHSQFDQGLQCFPFSIVKSESTLLAILSSEIKVCLHCHSQEQSD